MFYINAMEAACNTADLEITMELNICAELAS